MVVLHMYVQTLNRRHSWLLKLTHTLQANG